MYHNQTNHNYRKLQSRIGHFVLFKSQRVNNIHPLQKYNLSSFFLKNIGLKKSFVQMSLI